MSSMTRTDVQNLFDTIAEESGWDLTTPKLWQYFFVDASEAALKKAVSVLQLMGYQLEQIFPAQVAEGEAPYFFLMVSKLEVHTVSSLHKRNEELAKFAQKMGLAEYDGMDVIDPEEADEEGDDEGLETPEN
ncbi:ribonuclease E inhibitor RraB [Neisseriaceae bacterium CLB008]|nr:ribonuclease E inhibitor RraB [Neisseriaceae bacterium]